MKQKIIWMYWNEKIPKSVQRIVDHNKKVLTDWKINILNDVNIHQYVKYFPKNYDTIETIQQKSDWIRLYLLKTYGGIWSDISIIYNDSKKLDDLWIKSSNYDFTGFYNGNKINGIYQIIENYFLMADKNSTIINLWFHEYTKAIEEGLLNYKQRIMKEGTIIDANNRSLTDVYFTAYYCLQHVLQHLTTVPKMNLLNSHDSMYYLLKKCGWKNKKCRIKYFTKVKNKLPYIKLTKKDRTYLHF